MRFLLKSLVSISSHHLTPITCYPASLFLFLFFYWSIESQKAWPWGPQLCYWYSRFQNCCKECALRKLFSWAHYCAFRRHHIARSGSSIPLLLTSYGEPCCWQRASPGCHTSIGTRHSAPIAKRNRESSQVQPGVHAQLFLIFLPLYQALVLPLPPLQFTRVVRVMTSYFLLPLRFS